MFKGAVFDTTIESVAKKNNLRTKEYRPVTICIGEHQIIKGIDKSLVGKETGKKIIVNVAPEEAFGKKDAKLIRLVPLKTFHKQQVTPMPGLQVNIDGTVATVLRVSGGRVLVDFNHPLAGKEVTYDIDIKRIVTDKKEQLESMMKLLMPFKTSVSVHNNKAAITAEHELPKEFSDAIAKKLKELTELDIEFKHEKKEENEQNKFQAITETAKHTIEQ
jgi:FKBP-type peptidyl-prolyl cis-trans isomerase SlyD